MIGVYKITNLVNNKIYIGQSWNIEQRWAGHKRRATNGHTSHLYSSIRKYGIENFNFEIIKTINNSSLAQILLDSYEIFYITQYNSMNRTKGYNKRMGGSGGKMSEESRKKMSDAWTQQRKHNFIKLMTSIHTGKPSSKKQKESASRTFKGVPKSNEQRKKISDSNKGKIISLKQKQDHSLFIINYYKNNSHPMSGKHHSDQTKEKISKKAKKRIKQSKI